MNKTKLSFKKWWNEDIMTDRFCIVCANVIPRIRRKGVSTCSIKCQSELNKHPRRYVNYSMYDAKYYIKRKKTVNNISKATRYVNATNSSRNNFGAVPMNPKIIPDLDMLALKGCSNCGEKFMACLHFHHVIALNKGGSNELSNIQVLCSNCHIKFHNHVIKGVLL